MSELDQVVDFLLGAFPIYRAYARSERLFYEFLAKFHSCDRTPRYAVTGSFKEGYPDPLFSDSDMIIILNPPEEIFREECQRKVFCPLDDAPAHVKLIIPRSYRQEFTKQYHEISTFLDLIVETEEEGCFISADKARRLNRRDFLPDCIDEQNKPSAVWTERKTAEGLDLSPAYTFLSKTGVESDRVVAIECTGWPTVAREWVLRKPRYWPKADTVENISTSGFMIVPKPSDNSGDTRREWRFSFSIPEAALFDTFDEPHAMVYYMLRSLYVRSLKEKTCGALTSYHFKTIMFWVLEETEPSCWSRERIVGIFLSALKKLLQFTTDGFLPHYFVPSHNLFYKTSKQALELAGREIKFALDHPLEALDKMVTAAVVGLMPRLGLLSLNMKTKENMKVLGLPEYVAYRVFTQGEPRELVRKLELESFSQTLNDAIVCFNLFPEHNPLINFYLSAIHFGYALASVTENNTVAFDAEKLSEVGEDFLEMDPGQGNQALLEWAELVKIAVDDVIAREAYGRLLPFMQSLYTFMKEQNHHAQRLYPRNLTEGDKETLETFRVVCSTAGAFLATVKFITKDIAYSQLYELLNEVLPPNPAVENPRCADMSLSLFILGGGTFQMTNCFFRQ